VASVAAVSVAVLFAACLHPAPGTSAPRTFACLPAGVHPSDPVTSDDADKAPRLHPRTVEQALTDLGARCRKGRLVARGRDVRFIRLQGCWGNPPEDYREILKAQADEIESARRTSTVLTIPCTAGDPRRISESASAPSGSTR
jgi:hypothetical protein